MDNLPIYNASTYYQVEDRFHYGYCDLEAIKPIYPCEQLKIYDEEDCPNGNVKLLS